MKRSNQSHPRLHRKHTGHIHRNIWGVPLFSAFVTLLMVLPCFYWTGLYRRMFGRMITPPVLIVVSFCWILLVFFIIVGFAVIRFPLRADKKGPHPHRTMFDDVMDALDRIACGDYNVFVSKQGDYHYAELADKVNGLARDLNSLEQMRQEFISNVSHEIQSPLTSITGFAALLKKENLPPEQRLHYLDVIEAESRRLSRLSENLLRLSILDSDQSVLSLSSFRLDKQIRDSLLMLEPQWSAKSIVPDLDLHHVTWTGDADLLSQVWINLLHNSIKFTPPGGSISVRLKQEDNRIVCLLSDTGTGIPDADLIRIFERFYKVDKARDRAPGGSGLGLSIVHKIISLHKGTISVDSKPGEGTAFTVILPAPDTTSKEPQEE